LDAQKLTTKDIDAPQAALGISEEGEPGRTVGAACRPAVFGEHTSHNIFVDLDTE
jgi:hypothetical protein